jgi:hypothetical protein
VENAPTSWRSSMWPTPRMRIRESGRGRTATSRRSCALSARAKGSPSRSSARTDTRCAAPGALHDDRQGGALRGVDARPLAGRRGRGVARLRGRGGGRAAKDPNAGVRARGAAGALIEWGLCRWRCEALVHAAGYPVPRKSACVFCPYATRGDVRMVVSTRSCASPAVNRRERAMGEE